MVAMADNAPTLVTGAKAFGAISNNHGVLIGDAFGPVQAIGSQTNNHYHPARPETPPSPCCAIPLPRDLDFVDHGTLLDQIREKLSAPAARIALVGLGGVGKSQLAIEHCHRTADQSPETWVFWVHASNAARFEQSYRDIASTVKVPGRQNRKADIFQLVYDWLRDEKNGKWTLVLDNVDDAGFLLEPRSASHDGPTDGLDGKSSQPLVSYVPQCKNGSVLVTTRSRNVALQLVEQRDIVAVKPMDKRDAQPLLQKKLGQQDSEEVIELATALEFMPLAMVQAAAYISQRRPRCSVQQYLQDFRSSDRKRTSLFGYKGGQLRRDWEAKNSIIITWHISFDHIRDIRPSAANLLALMSFCDRQGIPEALIRNGTEHEIAQQGQEEHDSDHDDGGEKDDNRSQSSAGDGFEDDVLTLRDYSFISVNADGTTFEMHGLVQLAMRKWLQVHGQLERWKEQFVRNLCAAFPTGEYENWATCQTLFPHAQSALVQQPKREESLKEWALLLYNAACYAWERGNPPHAEKMSVESMKVRKKLFGPEKWETLQSMIMAGLAYKLGGRWREAEKLEVEVMERSVRMLGAEHPDTLTNMNNLALTYWGQGRWNEAEELGKRVLGTRTRVLGLEHLQTLTSTTNLALIYANQGRWSIAEQLLVQVVDILKRVLGAEHPDTLSSMSNLAATYWGQGRWNEATVLGAQVVEARKRVIGAEHPDTLTSIANLASIYQNIGRWNDAEELGVEVLEIRKRVLGGDHPDVLTSMNNLVLTYWAQWQWEKAEELFGQATVTCSRVLGAEHPTTLTNMANLAETYSREGRLEEAEVLQVQVLETRKKVLSAEHPDVLTSMSNLALSYNNQGRWEESEELQLQAMELFKMAVGSEHPSTLSSMANLASTYKNQGRWNDAEELEVQVVEIRKRVLGTGHPDTLSGMAQLASTYHCQGLWREAENLLTPVMEIREKVLGLGHPLTLTCMHNLAFVLKSRNRRKEALSLMRRSYQLRREVLGPKHPATEASLEAVKELERERKGDQTLNRLYFMGVILVAVLGVVRKISFHK